MGKRSIKLENSFDERNYVDSHKLASFINDSKIKITLLHDFFSSKGQFFFVEGRSLLANLAPFFILNKSSIDEILERIGERVKVKINGFTLLKSKYNIKKDSLFDELKNIFEHNDSYGDFYIKLSYKKSDKYFGNRRFRLIISFPKLEYGALKLGFQTGTHKVHIECIEESNEEIIVIINNHINTDYDTCLKLFQNECFKNILAINTFNFNELFDSRNEVIKSICEDLEFIVDIEEQKYKFSPIGVLKHTMDKNNVDDNLGDKYFNNITDGNLANCLVTLEELIDSFNEKTGGKGVIRKFHKLFISENKEYVLLIEFSIGQKLDLYLNSVRKLNKEDDSFEILNNYLGEPDNSDSVNESSLFRYKDFNNLKILPLSRDVSLNILFTFWYNISLQIKDDFKNEEQLNLGKSILENKNRKNI